MSESGVPHGMSAVTPALAVRDAAAAMDWYRDVFEAVEADRLVGEDGKVAHGELRIGGTLVMLGEESPGWKTFGPATLGGTTVRLHLYVDDVDAVFPRALEAGAEELIPLADQFYGDRAGRLRDPFGHEWIVATRVEDLTSEEIQARFERLSA